MIRTMFDKNEPAENINVLTEYLKKIISIIIFIEGRQRIIIHYYHHFIEIRLILYVLRHPIDLIILLVTTI